MDRRALSMPAVFLSASVPYREGWVQGAKPTEIRAAVRALVSIVLPKYELVFGGHPDISPMVESAARSLGAVDHVHIFQSRFFEPRIPEVARKFENFHWTDRQDSMESSLLLMRREMLRFRPYVMGIFIGGMEGVVDEFRLLHENCPSVPAYPIGATGSAAERLLKEHQQSYQELGLYPELSHSRLYQSLFSKLLARSLHSDGAH